jgi:Ni2+-binding GTPase involved in maturation of urease and hydrogenase
MIEFVTLGGFLGAGKTTTMIAAARLLEARGRSVAVVTNDQGTELIDTRLARSQLDSVGEVTGGCFCCRFEDLMTVTTRLLDSGDVDTVMAEAVGSCTDLQATVIRPLRAYYEDKFHPAPLTVIVDPRRFGELNSALPFYDRDNDMAYLFGHQLAEADIIAINKADLLTDGEREKVIADLAAGHPHATVLAYSAKTGEGLEELVAAWDSSPPPAPHVDIDYDRYAAAEAELAWFNQTATIAAAEPGFSPEQWTRSALAHLSEAARRNGWVIGHLKISVETAAGLTKASVTTAGETPAMDSAVTAPALSGTVNINARVACAPEVMDAAADAARGAADADTGATSTPAVEAAIAFRPGYPRPIHRITDPVG